MPPVVVTPDSNSVPLVATTSVYWLNGPKMTPMEPTSAPWSTMISSAGAVA